MFIVGIIFVLAIAASVRASVIYERAVAKGDSKKAIKHLENVGALYFTVAICLAFVIAGTLETAL